MIIILIVAASAVACVMIFISGLVDCKRSAGSSGITVTSSVNHDFEPDLIAWRSSFSMRSNMSRGACSMIKKDAGLVRKYLEDNQMSEDEMVFSSINISQKYTPRYDDGGRYLGNESDGYELTQTMTVSPYDIDKAEVVSRDISTLIEAGMELESNQSEYCHIKLNKVKLNLTEKVTASTKKRVSIITSETGGISGALLSANLGVLQITARNSSSELYSYDEVLGTSSRLKTAMITVWLNYSAQ